MIKTILVTAAGTETDPASFAAALAVARPFGAHLDVLHVRSDPTGAAVAMASDGGSGALTAGLIDQLEQDARNREAAAKQSFSRFCSEAALAETDAPPRGAAGKPSAGWHVETGDEPRWVAAYGLTADLILIARTPEEEIGRSTLEAALLETGRPLLIPAASGMPSSVDRVAIAWKPTAQASRAVALAMPFLLRAKEVAILTVEEPPGDHGPADRLVRNLAWHGCTARSEQLRQGHEGAAATLLKAAGERADLLVMGGYGHSRLREWVFGGFTQHALAEAPLAVLMAH
jgi:nucleotide-binding universal stress UspA family protein